MALRLKSIPRPTADIPKVIVDVLNPIRDAIEVRFLGKSSDERALTRGDLVKLGLVTQAEIEQLED